MVVERGAACLVNEGWDEGGGGSQQPIVHTTFQVILTYLPVDGAEPRQVGDVNGEYRVLYLRNCLE